MKKSSAVFLLTKSLTMSEKRYFKIFSERHTIGKQNKYVALFDLLDKAQTEDDRAIKTALRALGINSDFISADKNYLYRLILRSLNDFHDAKTSNLEIKGALLSIEILFYKGLYRECLKLISKAESIAEDCENFQLMIDLLTWKKKCSGYSLGLKKAAEVNLLIDKYVLLLNNYKKITDLYYQSYWLMTNNENYPRVTVIKNFRKIISQPEIKSEKNALSFSARIFYYLIYANYYFSLGNKEKEFDFLQRLVDIINRSKTYAAENPLDYLSIYNRLLSIKKHYRHTSFFNDIKVLNEFSRKSHIRKEVILQRVFIHTNTHELEYYLFSNNFPQALKKAIEIEKEITKVNLAIEPYHMINFYYLLSITFIYVGQFHKAVKYINRVLNDFHSEARPMVYIRVEILNAIVHYELKNYSLVRALSQTVLKNGNHHRILFPFEIKLLKALTKIGMFKQPMIKNEVEILALLADEIKRSGNSANANLADNYLKWVMAKISRKPVSELYK